MTVQTTSLKTGTVKAENKDRFQIDRVLTITGAHLVHDTFTAFLNPLLPLIIDKLQLSLAAAGSLAVFFRFPSLLNPLIGMLADRIDVCLMVVLAPTVTAIAMSLLGLAPSYGLVALLLLAAGLSSSALHVPAPVILTRISGGRVGTGMSFWMVAGELARTLGPLLAVAAVSWWTLEGYYPVLILGVFTSVVVYFRLRDVEIKPPEQKNSILLGEAWLGLRRLMIPLAIVILFRSLSRAALSTFLPVYVTSSGKSILAGGSTLAAVEFAGAIGALLAGTLSDRLGRRIMLFGALLLGPISMLVFLTAKVEVVGNVALLVTGFSSLSTTPVIMAMVQDHGRSYPATANGIYMGLSFIMGALAAPVLGWLGDRVGLNMAFIVSAIVAFLAIPAVFALPKVEMNASSDGM